MVVGQSRAFLFNFGHFLTKILKTQCTLYRHEFSCAVSLQPGNCVDMTTVTSSCLVYIMAVQRCKSVKVVVKSVERLEKLSVMRPALAVGGPDFIL